MIKFRNITKLFHQLASNSNLDLKMKVLNTSDEKAVKEAAKLLKEGKVIGIPTDTIYGLACSANDQEAIKSLYEIKGRNEEKPVAICVSDYSDLKHWGQADHLPNELIQQLLPGPVTIVLNKSIHLNNPYLNNGIERIGIRIPDFNFIRDVCREFSQPMALTSANKSSEKSTLNVEEFKHLWPSLGAVFNGGTLSDSEEQRKGSTVIDLSVPGEYQVIREGIAYERTIQLVHKYGIKSSY
jgi:tRNA threonylcarbamoyl adenosine modification protein (Sua5/YciO/YrdC/YwlC family)